MLRLLVTPRWLARHVLALLLVAGCLVAARWQLGRALSRHSVLNWSYVIEWSLFAGFVVLCWGWYLRDDLRGPVHDDDLVPAPVDALPEPVPVSAEEDPELAAYNAYLAELHLGRR